MTSLSSTAPRRGIVPHAVAALMILILGLGSGLLVGSSNGDPWYDALAKPWFMPPGWVFPVVWTTLYLLMGVVAGDLIMLREAPGRPLAIGLFALQLVLNLAWPPLFFGAHQMAGGLALIFALDIVVVTTVWAVARLCQQTAAMLLPYCVWLAVATALNAAIVQLN